MGFFDGIKEFYYSIEEKYYDFLDSINERIPVYEIIDPIDRIAPSLLVFIFLGLVFLALGGLAFLGFFEGPKDTLTINVIDKDAKAIEGALVSFSKQDADVVLVKTDSEGNAKYFGVKENDKVNVKVSKDGYVQVEKAVLINVVPQVEVVTLEKEAEASLTERTIKLVDSFGQTITEPLTLRFKCSNTSVRAPEPIDLDASSRGQAKVRVPNNCGRLTVDITDSTKYREVSGYLVSSEEQTIRLQPVSQPKGTLNVMVTDSKNEPLDGIRVEIYKYEELLENPNVGPLNGDITQSGQATFNELPGTYVLRTFDSAGVYGQGERRATITAGETSSVNISLAEDIKGKIKVKVVDKRNGSAIRNARVKLVFASNGNEVTTNTTNNDGETEFPLSREVDYIANVIAEGYQFKSVSGLRMSNDVVKIEVEKCTNTTCGVLRVKVVDQENNAINNAVVAIYNASTNNLAGYDTRKTDVNGIARFFGVSAGNYWAFAFREGFSGRSDAAYFNGAQKDEGEPNLIVKMDVGKSIVRVHVVDKEGNPIPFANVTLLDSRTNFPIAGPEFTDSNGTFEREIRANAKVYAIVKKEDEEVYTPYVTTKKSLVPQGVVSFEVVMEKPILDKKIQVLFKRLYEKDKKADIVKAGGKYIAKFQVRVPEKEEDETYDNIEMHIRAGEDTIMEKDEIYLGEVSAPLTRQIRATKFEKEATRLDASDYDVTIDDAKWVNVEWVDPLPGIYEVDAEVNIKNTASLGDKLVLNYKVRGEIGSSVERDPIDNTVTNELYSNTKQEIFEVGAVTLCDEQFCFTSTILDIEKDLLESVTDTYNARIFNKYRMLFIIKNNSQTIIHNNANLRVNNPDKSIKFFNYEAIDAETVSRKGVVNGFEFPKINVGELSPDKSVRIEAEFIPQKSINGVVNIKLASDQKIVYEKNLTIIVSAPQELSVEIDKTFFASGIPTDIKVVIRDSANGQEVDKAVVRILDKFDNVIDYAFTRPDGTATITLPGQKPGEKLKLQVEKANFNVKEIELMVSDKLVEATPSQLGVSLNTKDKVESSDKISIRNAAPYDLTIKQIALKGNFKKLVDIQKVRNWLESSYKGMALKTGERQEIVVKTFLSQDAMLLKQRQNIDAELEIIVSVFGEEWNIKVPVKISIGLGNEVDDPTCLVLSKNEWVTSTSGSPKRMEFLIQNNCTIGKKPVALQDLEAKINLKTNQIGEYKISIEGAGDTILRPGYFKLMLGKLEAQQSVTGILTFTPYGGVNGTAEAEVEIQASNPVDNGAQILNNKIKTKITSVNLTECLAYDKERIAINQKETGIFTITATEICGEPIDFEIKSPLKTNPERKFTLAPGQSRAIEVFAEQNNPGQYPVVISGKFGSDKKTQLAKNIRVIINAPGCWQLSKYEFEVYDDPKVDIDGFDSAKIANNCVERPVEVKVNTKDFLDALQDGLAYGAISAGLVMLTNWGAGDREILTGKPKTDNNKTNTTAQSEKQEQDVTNLPPIAFANILPITGRMSIGNSAAQGAAGSLAEGLLKSGAGLVRGVFGTSPLAAGLLGGFVGTLISYSGQEKEVPFTILQPDVEIQRIKLVQGEGQQAVEDDKIRLEVEGLGKEKEESSTIVPMPLTNTPSDVLSQGTQIYKAVFVNDSRLITTEEAPYYSNLLINGIRHKYKDKTYKKKDFYDEEGGFLGFFDTSTLNKQKKKLEEDLPSQRLEQTYKLEFNAVPPEIETIQAPSILNCQDGEKTGATGPDALPKIKLAWNWSSIAENECNENNPNGVYCDATQFSIAILKKIKILDDFLRQNASQFQCPTPGENTSIKNEIGSYDVGIASLDTIKTGNSIEVIAEVKNTNPSQIETDVVLKIKPISNAPEIICSGGTQKILLAAGTTQEVKCTFNNLAQGYYTANATISPKISCEKCEDVSATNSASKNLFIGESGLGQCTPYSTTRLAEFLKASGIRNNEIVQLVNFNALLMVDGYSKDFQHDFDVASNNTFFQAPEWYFSMQGIPESGLGTYFRDQKLFTFDAYSQPDFTLPGPGTYNITIDINYEDKDWKLFDNTGKPTAKIVVRMEKVKGAQPDSPFYYLPINGLVGVPPLDEDVKRGGRTGYGINFEGDSILIDNGSNAVRTVDIAGSAPIENGILKVVKSNNFKAMQIDERGVIAKLSRVDGGLELLYQPSNATPVMLEIEKKTSGSAYAVYQPAIDGDAVNVGPYLTKWNGVGASCRGFDGSVMSQQNYITDTHGISTKCALVGLPKESRYAFEFCQDPVNFGKVFYETIFYTPQDSDSRLEIVDIASDEARLIGTTTGKRVPLNGNGVTPRITSLQDIFNLVKDEYICITGSNIKSEFFWNPKKLYSTILPKEEEAINQCIASPNTRKAF